MCLIMRLNQYSEPLERWESDDIYRRNSDGIGIVYPDGTVPVRTIPRDADHAWSLVREVRGPAVIHWRMATHGSVTTENVHPFRIGKGLQLVHNGILSGWGHGTVSDTRHYAAAVGDCVRKHGLASTWLDPRWRASVAAQISGSVLVAVGRGLPDDGITIGDRSAVEHKGRWYSNTYAWSPVPTGDVDAARYLDGATCSLDDIARWVSDPMVAAGLRDPDPYVREVALDLACDELGIDVDDVDTVSDEDVDVVDAMERWTR